MYARECMFSTIVRADVGSRWKAATWRRCAGENPPRAPGPPSCPSARPRSSRSMLATGAPSRPATLGSSCTDGCILVNISVDVDKTQNLCITLYYLDSPSCPAARPHSSRSMLATGAPSRPATLGSSCTDGHFKMKLQPLHHFSYLHSPSFPAARQRSRRSMLAASAPSLRAMLRPAAGT